MINPSNGGTVWYALAAPGSHDRKLSMPLETYLALARTTHTEAEFRATFIAQAEISPLTPQEVMDLGYRAPVLKVKGVAQ